MAQQLRGQEALQALLANPSRYDVTSGNNILANNQDYQQALAIQQYEKMLKKQKEQQQQQKSGGGFMGFLKDVGTSIIDPFKNAGGLAAIGVANITGDTNRRNRIAKEVFGKKDVNLANEALKSSLSIGSYLVPGAGVGAGLGRTLAMGAAGGLVGSLGQQDLLEGEFDLGSTLLGAGLGAGTAGALKGAGGIAKRVRNNPLDQIDFAVNKAQKTMRGQGMADDAIAKQLGNTGKLGAVNPRLNALKDSSYRGKLAEFGLDLGDDKLAKGAELVKKQLPDDMASGFLGRQLDDVAGRSKQKLLANADEIGQQADNIQFNPFADKPMAKQFDNAITLGKKAADKQGNVKKSALRNIYKKIGLQADTKSWDPIGGFDEGVVKLEQARKFFDLPQSPAGITELPNKIFGMRDNILLNSNKQFRVDPSKIIDDDQAYNLFQKLSNRANASQDDILNSVNKKVLTFLKNSPDATGSVSDQLQGIGNLKAGSLQALRDATDSGYKKIVTGSGTATVDDLADFQISRWAASKLDQIPGYTNINQTGRAFKDAASGLAQNFNKGTGGAYIASAGQPLQLATSFALEKGNKLINRGLQATDKIKRGMKPVTQPVSNLMLNNPLTNDFIENVGRNQRIGQTLVPQLALGGEQGEMGMGAVAPDQILSQDNFAQSTPQGMGEMPGLSMQQPMGMGTGGGMDMGGDMQVDMSMMNPQQQMAESLAQRLELLKVLQNAGGGDLKQGLMLAETLGLMPMLQGMPAEGSRQGGDGRTLAASQVSQLGQTQDALEALSSLEGRLASGELSSFFGPVTGRIGDLAQKVGIGGSGRAAINTELNTLAQQLGKALEGGKLTDQDIIRYRQYLPNLNDTPSQARGKIQALIERISNQKEAMQSGFSDYGYEVPEELLAQPQQQQDPMQFLAMM